MPYTRTPWANYCPPPLDAANLINMEDGIWYGLAHSGGIRNTAEFLDRNPASTTGGLAEAIADLAGGAGVVFAAPHNHPIAANYAIPATVHLIASRGATFTIANGITFTINGTFEAGLYQIFSLVGTGIIVFGSGVVPQIYPDWWGATATLGLQEAVTSLGGSDGVIYLPPANYPINVNYTILANAHIIFANGAYCTVGNGITLTIDSTVEAGAYRIFVYVGTGKVVFGGSAFPTILAEWWGATATVGIQEAINSLPATGGEVNINRLGSVNITEILVDNKNGVHIIGPGQQALTLTYTGAGKAIRFHRVKYSSLSGFTLNGNASATDGVEFDGVWHTAFKDFNITAFVKAGAIGLHLTDTAAFGTYWDKFDNGRIYNCDIGILLEKTNGRTPNLNVFTRVDALRCGDIGLKMTAGHHNTYIGCDFSYGKNYNVYLSTADTWDNSFIESMGERELGWGPTIQAFHLAAGANRIRLWGGYWSNTAGTYPITDNGAVGNFFLYQNPDTIRYSGSLGLWTAPTALFQSGAMNPTLAAALAASAIGGSKGAIGRLYLEGSGQADVMLDDSGGGVDEKLFQTIIAAGLTKLRGLSDAAGITYDFIVCNMNDGGVLMTSLKSGINQGAAGAGAGELWVDTSAGNVVKRGT